MTLPLGAGELYPTGTTVVGLDASARLARHNKAVEGARASWWCLHGKDGPHFVQVCDDADHANGRCLSVAFSAERGMHSPVVFSWTYMHVATPAQKDGNGGGKGTPAELRQAHAQIRYAKYCTVSRP